MNAFNYGAIHCLYRNICVPHRGSISLQKAHNQCIKKSNALHQIMSFITHTTNKINKSDTYKKQMNPTIKPYCKTRFHTLYDMFYSFYNNMGVIRSYYNRAPMNQDEQWQIWNANETNFLSITCQYLKILEVFVFVIYTYIYIYIYISISVCLHVLYFTLLTGTEEFDNTF